MARVGIRAPYRRCSRLSVDLLAVSEDSAIDAVVDLELGWTAAWTSCVDFPPRLSPLLLDPKAKALRFLPPTPPNNTIGSAYIVLPKIQQIRATMKEGKISMMPSSGVGQSNPPNVMLAPINTADGK